MIKLLVIAGEQSIDITNHLNNTAAFKVDYTYNNLVDGKSDIINKIIQVDKLLYIYDPNVMNIRSDMSILQGLLTQDGFFSTSEIVFIQRKNENSKKAEDYFNAAMRACKNQLKTTKRSNEFSYQIHTIETLTFQEITDLLFGVTSSENFSNTIRNVYRYEKGSEATKAYTPKDTSKHRVEAFNFNNLDNYDRAKNNAIKTDTLIANKTASEKVTGVFEDIVFGKMDVKPVNETKIFVVSGKSKSGKSVFTSVLAASAIKYNSNLMILDLTSNNDIGWLLKKHSMPFQELKMINVIQNNINPESIISLLTINRDDYEILYDFFTLLGANITNLKIKNVVIVCDYKELHNIISIFDKSVKRVFITSTPLQKDLEELKYLLQKLNHDIYVILNNSISLMDNVNYPSNEYIKEILPDRCRIVAPIRFDNLNIQHNYFSIFTD